MHILSPLTDNCSSWISGRRKNGGRNVFMTKSPRKNVPDVGIELGATCMPSRHASDRATAPMPGTHGLIWEGNKGSWYINTYLPLPHQFPTQVTTLGQPDACTIPPTTYKITGGDIKIQNWKSYTCTRNSSNSAKPPLEDYEQVYIVHTGFAGRKPTSNYEPHRDKTNKMAYAPSQDSDQPGHPPSLIRESSLCA